MTDYSSKAQKLIELLSNEETQQIQRDNPFRVERNDKIRELFRRGVRQAVLAEVSGMSMSSIGRVCAGVPPFTPGRSKGD
jgi:hypothetical protein